MIDKDKVEQALEAARARAEINKKNWENLPMQEQDDVVNPVRLSIHRLKGLKKLLEDNSFSYKGKNYFVISEPGDNRREDVWYVWAGPYGQESWIELDEVPQELKMAYDEYDDAIE
jgi:hypothetical protein